MERGRVLKRHGLFFYSPSQTGKASGFKYLCRTDRVDYSLGFINGSASEARLCGIYSPSQTGKVGGPVADAARIGLIIHWALYMVLRAKRGCTVYL